jgi:hypothetical protein
MSVTKGFSGGTDELQTAILKPFGICNKAIRLQKASTPFGFRIAHDSNRAQGYLEKILKYWARGKIKLLI